MTAVELDPALAELYQERFPNDRVIVDDAHGFLLSYFNDFDFIWGSPPCPTHSRARFWYSSNPKTPTKPVYPDMVLYQEIILLKHYFKGLFCVENVIPYYEPLIPGKKIGRHIYWTNFKLPSNLNHRPFEDSRRGNEMNRLKEYHNFDFSKYKGKQPIKKIARNLVDYEAGKAIFQTAERIINQKPVELIGLFNQSF